MLDLNFTVEGAEPAAARRGAAPGIQTADQRDASAATSRRRSRRSPCAARSASSRPAGGMRRPNRNGSSTCSASPSAGGRRCRSALWTHASVVVPPFTGRHARRPARSLLVRFQCRRDQILSRTRRRRGPALPAVQRHDLLHGRRWFLAGQPDPLGKRGNVPAAGIGLERHDRAVLSQ